MPPVTTDSRNFTTRAGVVRPVLRVRAGPSPAVGAGFTVAGEILQRYDQGRSGLEETILELFYGGISPAHAEISAGRLLGPSAGLGELAARARTVSETLTTWLDRALARGRTCIFLQAATITRKSVHGLRETEVRVAVGVDPRGGLEVLGIDASPPDTGSWDGLLGGLRRRGLPDVDIFVGDCEPGALDGMLKHFPRARYQVCLERLEERMLYKVPAALVHTVVDGFIALRTAANVGAARAVTTALRTRLIEDGHEPAAALLDGAGDHLFTSLAYPAAQRAHLRDASFLKKPLGHLRARVRALGPGLDDEALVLLMAARLRQTWPENKPRRFKALARPAA